MIVAKAVTPAAVGGQARWPALRGVHVITVVSAAATVVQTRRTALPVVGVANVVSPATVEVL